VADDAYISVRVVDNLVDGYGLRWNVDERVEVSTHPLWLLLHVPIHALTGNLFLGTLALCVACSAAAVALAAASQPGRPATAAFALVVPLACSSAFVDYATSGLENPLSFLLFAAFGYALMRHRATPPGLGVGLIVGLALWNRLDTLFLYAPPLAWLLWVERRRVRWLPLALGLSPVLAWQAFRLLYFGFFFPNTRYAKLDAGPELGWYLERGVAYLLDLLQTDPASALLGGAGLVAGLGGWRAWRDPASARRGAVALGILAYCAFVVRVGGDFMAGRMWSLPIFAAAWCLYAALAGSRGAGLRMAVPVALALGLTALLRPDAAQRDRIHARADIVDEREFYAPSNALWTDGGGLRSHVLDNDWAQLGLQLRAGKRTTDVVQYGSIGMLGFYAGPEVTIVDQNGLCDALLARLPTRKPRSEWRIGHLSRKLPYGYLAARRNGDTSQMHPELARYYEKLRRVTAGPLLDRERLGLIWGFLWGEHQPPTRGAKRGWRPRRRDRR
jgi:arabinofuranosyltransferase